MDAAVRADRAVLPEAAWRWPAGRGAGTDAAHPRPAVVRAIRSGGRRGAVRLGHDMLVGGHRPGEGTGPGPDDGVQVPASVGAGVAVRGAEPAPVATGPEALAGRGRGRHDPGRALLDQEPRLRHANPRCARRRNGISGTSA